MKRSAAAKIVRERLADRDIVVCSLGSTGRAWREQDAPQLTYFASDPMGTAPALALGLALAQPQRRVVLLEGDGDLVMNLGVLVTIAGAAPPNLRVAVFTNARYETGGGQPLPNGQRISFAQVAKGAGWSWAEEGSDEKEAAKAVSELLTRTELGLVALHVEAEAFSYPSHPGPTSQAEDVASFRERLAESG